MVYELYVAYIIYDELLSTILLVYICSSSPSIIEPASTALVASSRTSMLQYIYIPM